MTTGDIAKLLHPYESENARYYVPQGSRVEIVDTNGATVYVQTQKRIPGSCGVWESRRRAFWVPAENLRAIEEGKL